MTDATKTCSEPGCNKPHKAKGLCGMHHQRQIRMIRKPCPYSCGRDCLTTSKSCRQCWYENNRGVDNPNYKNGKHYTGNGYVMVSGYQDHPNSFKRGTIPEHVLVMSEHLGRPLEENETVHHLGAKDDNRINMLQLRQGAHGRGQAYECADCGSDRYGRDCDECLQCTDCQSFRIKPIPLKGE